MARDHHRERAQRKTEFEALAQFSPSPPAAIARDNSGDASRSISSGASTIAASRSSSAPHFSSLPLFGQIEQGARITLGDSRAFHRRSPLPSLSMKPSISRPWSLALEIAPDHIARERRGRFSQLRAHAPLGRFGQRGTAHLGVAMDSVQRSTFASSATLRDLEGSLLLELVAELLEFRLERRHPRRRLVGQIFGLGERARRARQGGANRGSAIGKEFTRRRSRETNQHSTRTARS